MSASSCGTRDTCCQVDSLTFALLSARMAPRGIKGVGRTPAGTHLPSPRGVRAPTLTRSRHCISQPDSRRGAAARITDRYWGRAAGRAAAAAAAAGRDTGQRSRASSADDPDTERSAIDVRRQAQASRTDTRSPWIQDKRHVLTPSVIPIEIARLLPLCDESESRSDHVELVGMSFPRRLS